MRTIDADALYKRLKIIRNEEVLLHGRRNNKDCCTLSTALYEIEHAHTIEPEPQWILCSKRLPDKEGEYIVTDDAGGIATVETDEFYYDEDTGEPSWLFSQNVTAWMPFSKPYRRKTEEDEKC